MSTNRNRKPRRRIAKGPARPRYLESADLDRVVIMFVAMLSELLALRDRLEMHECLLARDGRLTAASMEAFRPTAEMQEDQEARRLMTLRRVFRVLRDEFEDYAEEELPT